MVPWYVAAIAMFVPVAILSIALAQIGRMKDKYKLDLENAVAAARRDASAKTKASAVGAIAEQFVPFKDEFPFCAKDAKFLGMPIDYVVFDGAFAGQVDKVVFVEIKAGSGHLSATQRQIKQAIVDKKVEWLEIRLV